jgi:hypothetical protein
MFQWDRHDGMLRYRNDLFDWIKQDAATYPETSAYRTRLAVDIAQDKRGNGSVICTERR